MNLRKNAVNHCEMLVLGLLVLGTFTALRLSAAQSAKPTAPSGAWVTNGNTVADGSFLGTLNNLPLEMRVGNLRALKLEPDPRGIKAANVIGGCISNRIEQPGSGGNVIGGGGFPEGPNIIHTNSSGVFIGAGSLNEIGPNASDVVIGGGWGNNARTYGATVGGGKNNSIQTNADYATIGGGTNNAIAVNSPSATIAGGDRNQVTALWGTVGGGVNNTASGVAATAGGGNFNVASGGDSTVAGGFFNQGNGPRSAVGGGEMNIANGEHATVPGGVANAAAGSASFAAGTRAKAITDGSFVWADAIDADFASSAPNQFLIRASGGVAIGTSDPAGAALRVVGTVKADGFDGPVPASQITGGLSVDNLSLNPPSPGQVLSYNGTSMVWQSPATANNVWALGGNSGTSDANFLGTTDNQSLEIRVDSLRALRLEPDPRDIKAANIIGGCISNRIEQPGSGGNVIGGGGFPEGPNIIHSNSSGVFIGAGSLNEVGPDASDVVIGGGWGNFASSYGVTIGGGKYNSIQANADYAMIGGGTNNAIAENSLAATITGGDRNRVTAQWGTVGGGVNNTASGVASTLGGGNFNVASGGDSTIAGGFFNQANGLRSAVGGGNMNVVQAPNGTIGGGYGNIVDGFGGTVAGGLSNSAGGLSFAAGQLANATADRSFVWNSFSAPATGLADRFGVFCPHGLNVDYHAQLDNGDGDRWLYVGDDSPGETIVTWTGAHLTDTGVWSNNSDKNRKTDFRSANTREVLEKLVALPLSQWRYTNDAPGIKHLGPMAQDFRATFGLGTDEKSIGTVDADGVALAAIQGLHELVQEQRAIVVDRERQNDALSARVADLERKLAAGQQALANWESRFTALEQTLARIRTPAAPPNLSQEGVQAEVQ